MNAANSTHGPSDVETLNSLLRSELAAVETYRQVLTKCEDPHVLTDLRNIREEHVQAEVLLREQVLQLGGEPVDSSEPWSACAAMVADAQVVTPVTALAALKQGEEHVCNEFEDCVKHKFTNTECLNLVQSKLLPTSRKHVAELNRLMGVS
jgi:bacterioferritin (cytochrome b1)